MIKLSVLAVFIPETQYPSGMNLDRQCLVLLVMRLVVRLVLRRAQDESSVHRCSLSSRKRTKAVRMMKEAVAVLFLSHMMEQHTTNAPLPAAMGNFGVLSVLHLFNFTPIIGLVVVSNRMN